MKKEIVVELEDTLMHNCKPTEEQKRSGWSWMECDCGSLDFRAFTRVPLIHFVKGFERPHPMYNDHSDPQALIALKMCDKCNKISAIV